MIFVSNYKKWFFDEFGRNRRNNTIFFIKMQFLDSGWWNLKIGFIEIFFNYVIRRAQSFSLKINFCLFIFKALLTCEQITQNNFDMIFERCSIIPIEIIEQKILEDFRKFFHFFIDISFLAFPDQKIWVIWC